jgi:tRNA A37 threonylcarbamoyladenosine modification protein TsaB
MNVLAIQSSGDETSVCVIHNENVISYRLSHQRKDRPNWNEMLSKIGLDSSFILDDIDLFSYANSSGSYTATRTVASFMKGIAVVLKKPLIAVKTKTIDTLNADAVAKIAMKQFEDSGRDVLAFSAESANPIYATDPQYKKINE